MAHLAAQRPRMTGTLVCTLLGVALWVFVASVEAVNFRLDDTQPICFVEEIAAATKKITGEYGCKRCSAVGVSLDIQDSNGVSVHHHEMKDGNNAFYVDMDTQVQGEYTICITAGSQGWLSPNDRAVEVTFSVDQQVRSSPTDGALAGVTKRTRVQDLLMFTFTDHGGQLKEMLRSPEYLENLDSILAEIVGATESIEGDLTFFEGRLLRMRQTSESTFDRVWMCSSVLMAVICGVAWMQLTFLKSFLRRKKLV